MTSSIFLYYMTRRFDAILALSLLGITAIVLVIGQSLGASDLSILRNHISQFAARPDKSGWLVCLSMWGFGLTYLATAACVLKWRGDSGWVRWGCLCLAAAAGLLPFVAEYKLWVAPQPEPPTIIERAEAWFSTHILRVQDSKPKAPPKAAERQKVHNGTIKASMRWVVAGMLLIGMGAIRPPRALLSAVLSGILAVGAFVLFFSQ